MFTGHFKIFCDCISLSPEQNSNWFARSTIIWRVEDLYSARIKYILANHHYYILLHNDIIYTKDSIIEQLYDD